MSILSAVRTYIATCPSLATGALLVVDHIGSTPIQYGIIPIPGEQILERYLNGSSLRVFPFMFQTVMSTAGDLERIENAGFQEVFMDWLESQSNNGTFPTLGAKQTAESIEAVSWGYLYEEGKSDTGIYQIQCRLIYKQVP